MNPERWQQVKSVAGAALELETSARAAFLQSACGDDAALRAEADSLLAGSGEVIENFASDLDSTLQAANAETARSGQRVGAYEILSEIGSGGMGAVYLARRADQQFTKQVAIKILKRGTDTAEVLRRFRAEREILARLEHPNIARLLDAGMTDDSLPYFVMEHVVGTPMTDYCAARALGIPERLRLFAKVCAAVQFAHQHLVVHRDLKPPNILITAGGEPKLLDFGIAKLLDPSQTPVNTVAERQWLTPAYASPEQVRGDAVTTGSDVYTMGALLYELLAGVSPHRFAHTHPSPTELFRIVAEVDPLPPSLTARAQPNGLRIPSDLDRIVLKALRKEPAARYPTIGAFADDLVRFNNGLPVRARPATFGYRASRFVRRHRLAVAASVILLAVIALGVTSTVVSARRAQREAQRAALRFNDVRQLASSFLFELHDTIARLPGTTEARQLLVSRALEYLDKLAREGGNERELQIELASAYTKIGDVQGRPYTANLGESAGAARSYGKAIAITAPLAAQEQATTNARQTAAVAHLRLAAVQARLNQLDAAKENNRAALALGESLLRENPAQANQWRPLIISSHWGLGDAIQAGNHQRRDPALHRASLEEYRLALAFAEELIAAQPDSLENMFILAKSCSRAAIVSQLGVHTGDPVYFDEALALHARSVEMLGAMLRRQPGNAQYRRMFADGIVTRASVRVLAQRELDEALADCEQALELEQALAASDPSNAEAQQDLSYAHYTTGRILQLLKRNPAAADHFRASINILQPLVAGRAENIETAFDLERSQQGLDETAPPAPGQQKE